MCLLPDLRRHIHPQTACGSGEVQAKCDERQLPLFEYFMEMCSSFLFFSVSPPTYIIPRLGLLINGTKVKYIHEHTTTDKLNHFVKLLSGTNSTYQFQRFILLVKFDRRPHLLFRISEEQFRNEDSLSQRDDTHSHRHTHDTQQQNTSDF